MHTTLLRLVMVLAGLVLAPLAQAANHDTVNVLEAGLVGDGLTNNSAVFQALLDRHGHETVYYFPAGVYRMANLALTDVHGLTFTGDGPPSIWQYDAPPAGYLFVLTCTRCMDLTFQDLAIDNRGILRYGGLRFYSASDIVFQRTHFYDSAPQPPGEEDRYAIVFGRGAALSSDIWVSDSVFHHLALEVDHASHVTIHNNTFYNTQSTAAIGSFSIADGSLSQDVVVDNNVIIHPAKCGICFNLDPASTHETRWRNLTVVDNLIQRRTGGYYNIRFGTSNTSVPVSGTVFDQIVAQGNRVDYVGLPADYPAVALTGYESYGITFTGTMITGNAVYEVPP